MNVVLSITIFHSISVWAYGHCAGPSRYEELLSDLHGAADADQLVCEAADGPQHTTHYQQGRWGPHAHLSLLWYQGDRLYTVLRYQGDLLYRLHLHTVPGGIYTVHYGTRGTTQYITVPRGYTQYITVPEGSLYGTLRYHGDLHSMLLYHGDLHCILRY